MNNQISNSTDTPTARRQNWRLPRYEVKSGKEAYELQVFLPGVQKEQAEVTIEKDQLLVVGRRSDIRPEGSKVIHEELGLDDYRLQLQLNVNVDPERISAQSADGILSVHLPLAEESKPRAISVE